MGAYRDNDRNGQRRFPEYGSNETFSDSTARACKSFEDRGNSIQGDVHFVLGQSEHIKRGLGFKISIFFEKRENTSSNLNNSNSSIEMC